MTRNILPQRRAAENFAVEQDGQRAVVTIGYYPDGSVGEVFINAPKVGSSLESTARDGAVLISLGLQYGVPLDVMRHAITRNTDGSASTIVGAAIDKLAEESCQ